MANLPTRVRLGFSVGRLILHYCIVFGMEGATTTEITENQRTELTDAHVTEYDKLDDDGDKIKEKKIQGPQGTTNTRDVNRTHLFQDAPSKTDDLEIIVIEAELVDGGKDLANPHLPVSGEVLSDAMDRLDQKGLTPAWEQ